MKRLFLLLAAIVIANISIISQNADVYTITKKDATIEYSTMYGNRLMGYLSFTVSDVINNDNDFKVKVLCKSLNKKKKPMKTLIGPKEGVFFFDTVKDSVFYLTHDIGMVIGGKNRHGYLLEIPNNLKVGDMIEGGTLNFEYEFMGIIKRNELRYSDFKVIEEVDLSTEAGVIKCLKVTGNVSGEYQDVKVNDNQTWYIAPGIGIVRQELSYMGEKRPIVVEICSISGL